MLSSESEEYDQQQRIAALAAEHAARLEGSPVATLVRVTRTYQAASIAVSLRALPNILEEQGIRQAPLGRVIPQSLLTDPKSLTELLRETQTPAARSRLAATLTTDAGRTARSVDMAVQPTVSGYIRSLRPPSCGRCAILAGRIYPKSEGFKRHPRCDCLMTPTTDTIGPTLVTDPDQAFKDGYISGLSKADTKALELGANLGQVVNIRKKSGLLEGSSVLKRGRILTPQGCLARAGDDERLLVGLLKRHGYITT